MLSSQLILEEENELRNLLVPQQPRRNNDPDFLSENNSLFDLKFEESPQTHSPPQEPVFFKFPLETTTEPE